jgi:excisionase family DNA binding protein
MLSPIDVANRIGVSRQTVHNWARSGFLPAPVRIRRTIRWEEEQIEEWLAKGFCGGAQLLKQSEEDNPDE